MTNQATEVRLTVDGKYIKIEAMHEGKVEDRDRFNPDSKSGRLRVLRSLGVDDATFLSWIDNTRNAAAAGDLDPKSFPINEKCNVEGDVIVRKMDERDDQGRTYPLDPVSILTNLLPLVAIDEVLKWKGDEKLCCLDIDYHERPAPHESWLTSRVTADLAPRPYAWHLTRRGGLHLFYIATKDFEAGELAAAAALCWRRIDPSCGIELKTTLRGPGDKPVIYTPGEVQDTTALLCGWVDATPADTDARDEWLAAEGLEIGKRYGHSKCPIFPTPGYDSSGEPVTISDTGVYCFNCEGAGRSLGCRRPGFAPFGVITGSSGSGDMGLMVKNLCHWGHARYVLTRKYGMLEPLAKKAYAAALKAYHHGTARAALVPMAFQKNTDNLTRMFDDWCNMEEGTPWKDKGLENILGRLPVAIYLDEKEQPKSDASTVCVLSQTHSLEKYGYPAIDRIHGYSLTRQHMTRHDRPAMIEVIDPDLTKMNNDRALPRYVPASRRGDMEKQWAVLEDIFPGIDRTLVELTICGIGSAQETQAGMPPFLFVAGASGSAKTTTTKIGAAILGARCADFVFKSDEMRWAQQMYECNQNGGVIILNELIKDTHRSARGRTPTPTEPFDPLLNVTPQARVPVMYKGPRAYGRIGMIVVTEPACPVGLRDEVQIARRFRYWLVKNEKKWDWSLKGVSSIPQLRLTSPAVADACNAIMSDIIDRRFFETKSWDTIADDLGAKKISESEEFRDFTPMLQEFFRLVCLEPEISNPRLAKRYSKGYKRISRNSETTKDGDENPLTMVYSMFADGQGNDWMSSRRLTEKDWTKILKADDHVELDLTNDGVNIYVRFRVGRLANPTRVNQEIVDPTNWEARS